MSETDATHEPGAVAPEHYKMMVLLVDDQVMIGEAIRRALASESTLHFHYCAEPGEALAIARKIQPTVILQDLVMPGVDGLSLVRQYRADARTRDIPIIVLSTKEEPAVKSAAFAAGANDYLVKLPDAVELIARLRHHSKAYLNQVQRDEAYRALHESQRKLLETNIELQRLTNVDGLTGLSNRRYFNEFVTAQWKLAIRDHKPFAMLMIDVDDFKRYNDSYGHVAGDEVLKRIAESMRESFRRPTDLLARFGGEEFVVLLPATPLEAVRALGERLRERIEAMGIAHRASSVGKVVTASIGGAAKVPGREDSFVPFMEDADAALYEAKHAGKNRVVVHGQPEDPDKTAG
jgi:two-component system, chemotaxis family, response regulator WspR